MRARESDLTTYARVRNAALEGFASNGEAATSIRNVAKAAGVSPGLVQHHFPTKAALRAAVDQYVEEVAIAAFSDFRSERAAGDPLEELGRRVTRLVREQRTALLYVARSVIEGDEAALELFDSFASIADAQWQRLEDEGVLRADLDRMWAMLHAVVINLGAVAFEAAIDRHLDRPFHTEASLERWRQATTLLFREGLYRRDGAGGS